MLETDRDACAIDRMHELVGRRIREARHARGLSLAALGGDDLSRSFLSLVERGRARISLRALAIVADRLELPITHFLSDTDALPWNGMSGGATAMTWSISVRQPGPYHLILELAPAGDSSAPLLEGGGEA